MVLALLPVLVGGVDGLTQGESVRAVGLPQQQVKPVLAVLTFTRNGYCDERGEGQSIRSTRYMFDHIGKSNVHQYELVVPENGKQEQRNSARFRFFRCRFGTLRGITLLGSRGGCCLMLVYTCLHVRAS